MAYDIKLADRVREYLTNFSKLNVEEKEMFSGLCFLVNQKMCVNVSGENLMCRYNPELFESVAERTGYHSMVMKGKEMKGYCYVSPDGFQSRKDFEYWMNLCLDFNEKAKSSKKPKPKKKTLK